MVFNNDDDNVFDIYLFCNSIVDKSITIIVDEEDLLVYIQDIVKDTFVNFFNDCSVTHFL